MYKRSLRNLGLALGAGTLLVGPSMLAASGTTAVNQLITSGLLVLTTTPTATMTGATLNNSSAQTSTGSLGLISVTDSRGSGAGWSVTATATSFSKANTPVHVTGTAGSLVTLGSYTGSASGTYTVTIVTGGVLGTATYAVSGLETQAATATGVAVPLGTKGLSATFASATYSAGDQWTVGVDTIPISNLTVTPSAVTAVLGGTTGVSAGSAHTYNDGTDPVTIMTSTTGNGLGQYNDTPSLSLVIPPGTKAGSYTATVTETAN